MPAKPEWKARQVAYHAQIGDDWPDELSTVPHCIRCSPTASEIVADTVAYLTSEVTTCYFPAKTFAVALLYARLLQDYFAVPMLEALADEELLFGNMRDFEPYPDQRGIYPSLLQLVDLDDVLARPPSLVAETIRFFKIEFLIT